MKGMQFFLALFLWLTPTVVLGGTAYYVDCSARSDGNGSYANPWNNLSSVNTHGFNAGDDVFFKVNTTCIATEHLDIDWTGTPDDYVIIGAYYGDRQFGLYGQPRPVLDGDNQSVPSPASHKGMIDIQREATDYIRITNLRINSSGNKGVNVKFADYIYVDNCYIYRPASECITYSTYAEYGDITNNECYESKYPSFAKGGAGISLNWDGTDHHTIAYNIVGKGAGEGIGLFHETDNNIVEYNVVYDRTKYHIYIDAGAYNIIRYNLVYSPASPLNPSRARGIVIGTELKFGYDSAKYNEVYGNLVAACSTGFSFYPEGYDGQYSNIDYNKIYNNTFVDNDVNINLGVSSATQNFNDNEVKNNISFTTSANYSHVNDENPTGVTFSHNLYDDSVGKNAGNKAVIGDPKLAKTSGWRSLTSGALSGTEFVPQAGSAAANAGQFLTDYNYRIILSDFTAHPIRVSIATDETPDIGAWMHEKSITGLDSPGFLRIVEAK